jgi:succinyl-CoA synthetase beta subunit
VRLLEYESKEILKKYRIPTPKGKLLSPADPIDIDHPVVLKGQIPIVGRGKAGGVLDSAKSEEANAHLKALFSKRLSGYRVKKVLVVDREQT